MFVMGDNRNNFFDFYVWGLLSKNRIIGRVTVKYWSSNKIGGLLFYVVVFVGVFELK